MKAPKAGQHCRVHIHHWSRYVEGDFSPAECRRCEAHLAECPSCRAKLKALGLTLRACRTAAARAAMPAGVKARARKRAKDILGKA